MKKMLKYSLGFLFYNLYFWRSDFHLGLSGLKNVTFWNFNIKDSLNLWKKHLKKLHFVTVWSQVKIVHSRALGKTSRKKASSKSDKSSNKDISAGAKPLGVKFQLSHFLTVRLWKADQNLCDSVSSHIVRRLIKISDLVELLWGLKYLMYMKT